MDRRREPVARVGVRGVKEAALGGVHLEPARVDPLMLADRMVLPMLNEAVACVLPGGRTMLVPCRRPGEKSYRFEALESHSRLAPEPVWRALGPLLGDYGGPGAS